MEVYLPHRARCPHLRNCGVGGATSKPLRSATLAERDALEREVDVAGLLTFAERVLTDLGALCKATVFPLGVTFDGEAFEPRRSRASSCACAAWTAPS
jgi:hypothetical protein